jgi:hypothetical protein
MLNLEMLNLEAFYLGEFNFLNFDFGGRETDRGGKCALVFAGAARTAQTSLAVAGP